MKIAIALLCFLAVPVAAEAQTHNFLDDYETKKGVDDFTASVDLRGQAFVRSTIPNRMLDDYTNYDHVPGQQMDVLVRSNLVWNFTLDTEVYAWIGENQWISRIGLMGELKYQTPLEWISVGYGHHSWHNIDVDIAKYVGHQQDWALLRIDAPKLNLGESSWIRASVEPYYFMGNKEPILIKDMYGPSEEHARYMLALPLIGAVGDFDFEIKSYVQFGKQNRRYGMSAEFVYNFTPFFAAFASVEYFFNPNGKAQDQEGVGIMLRLKR